MNNLVRTRFTPILVSSSFIIFGIALFTYSHSPKLFTEERLIFDLIWMDAWSLSFLGALIGIWLCRLKSSVKVFVCIGLLSVYLIVTTGLILNGTPYYLFGYWGDQAFRQAIVLKFATFAMPSDFYYKDLPTFYPPLYYFLQSLYARIFSVEAYKMAKIGQMLIFALLPFILFYFWRRIVTPLQAGLITLFAFLYSNYAGSLQYFSPHSFVAYALFIPWWLFYIERITKPVATWKFYISGGIIGALLFATYFYAFFIGAVWLFLRFTYVQLSRRRSRPGGYSLAGALRVLAASALFSAPYWLPVIFSIVKNGIDRSRGGWYHIGYPGIDFQFIIFSFEGLALLIGIIFIFRRVQRPLNLSLAVFVLTVLIIHFLGSLSGALGISINLAKSTDLFTHQLAAPIIGL